MSAVHRWLSLRRLAREPGRTLLVVAGVALGVAVVVAIQLASRHSRLSARMSVTRSAKATHAPSAARAPASVSTRNLTPYCALTEQPTAPSTATRMAAWRHGRCRT